MTSTLIASHRENVSKRLSMANEQFSLTYCHRYSHKFSLLQSLASFGDNVLQKRADGYGQEYPYLKESVHQI